MTDAPSPRDRMFRLLRWGLCGLVLWFVADRATDLWRQSPDGMPAVSPGWLVLAAVCYLGGWLPSVWFMQRLLIRFDQRPGWLPLARAYYCGHLGKYVPGKATVLLIRSGLLRPYGVPIAQSALGVVIETLGVMAVGLAVAAALSGWVFPETVWQSLPAGLSAVREMKWLGPVSVTIAAVVLIPLCSGLASRIAVRLAQKEVRSVEAADDKAHGTSDGDPTADSSTNTNTASVISADLLFRGTVAFVGTWLLFGLSLGCVLLSLGHSPDSISDWLSWTCATAAGTSLGFIVLFAPGGLGVREGLIIAVLEPSVGGKLAIAAAALLRVVWFASEVIAAAVLYFTRPSDQQERSTHGISAAGKDGT